MRKRKTSIMFVLITLLRSARGSKDVCFGHKGYQGMFLVWLMFVFSFLCRLFVSLIFCLTSFTKTLKKILILYSLSNQPKCFCLFYVRHSTLERLFLFPPFLILLNSTQCCCLIVPQMCGTDLRTFLTGSSRIIFFIFIQLGAARLVRELMVRTTSTLRNNLTFTHSFIHNSGGNKTEVGAERALFCTLCAVMPLRAMPC